MNPFGTHLLLDLYGAKANLLNNEKELEKIFLSAIEKGGAKIIETCFNRFSPQGISGVVVISESHVTCHTWPEEGFAAIDIFTCGDPEVGEKICSLLLKAFSPKEHFLKIVTRGKQTGHVKKEVVNR